MRRSTPLLVVIGIGRFLTLLAVLLLPQSAAAQSRWRLIGDWGSRKIWLDAKTIVQLDPSGYRAWVRTVFTPSIPLESGAHAKSAIDQFDVDCPGRRWRIYSFTNYDAEGNSVQSVQSGEKADWQTATPDTFGESILDAVCRYTTKHTILSRAPNPSASEPDVQPTIQDGAFSKPIPLYSEYCRKWGCPATDSTDQDSTLARDTAPTQ